MSNNNIKKDLFSVKAVINGKDYIFKLGNRELIEAEENGINIADLEGSSIKNMLKIAHIAMKCENKMTFENFIDFIDESDLNNEELGELVESIVDKGLMKGKKPKSKNITSNTTKKE